MNDRHVTPLEALIEAGSCLANAASNLSQQANEPLHERDALSLKTAQGRWDAAFRAYRLAVPQPQPACWSTPLGTADAVRAAVSTLSGEPKVVDEHLKLLLDIEANARRAWTNGTLSHEAWPVELARRLTLTLQRAGVLREYPR